MGKLWIGLSGFSYKPWQGEGRFYPPGLKSAKFLEYYAERYNAVEMDGSWYKVPAAASIEQWRDKTPDCFQFCFKMHRKVTHMARLKPESMDMVHFNLKRMAPLAAAGKFGPILLQLPPNLKRNDDRLAEFVNKLPKKFSDVPELENAPDARLRFGVEFRHETWDCNDIHEILSSAGVGWVGSDRDEAEATRRDTSDFLYLRIRRSDTDHERLKGWADYIQPILQTKDVYVFCKHEDEGSPWEWADDLAQMLSG